LAKSIEEANKEEQAGYFYSNETERDLISKNILHPKANENFNS